MKVRITHMKAPWPEGAKIGDVLEVSEVAPWALGKCVTVGEDEEVTFTAPAKPPVSGELRIEREGSEGFTPLGDGAATGDGTGEALPPIEKEDKPANKGKK